MKALCTPDTERRKGKRKGGLPPGRAPCLQGDSVNAACSHCWSLFCLHPLSCSNVTGNSLNSVFLPLQGITFITRQCFSQSHQHTWVQWAGAEPQQAATARGWGLQGTHHRLLPGCQGYPNHSWGKERRALTANAQSAVPPWGSDTRKEGSCRFPLSLMTPKYMNIVIGVLKNAGVQALQN